MTLNEIIVQALQQLKRGTDAQTIDNYRNSFLQYANMAQQDLSKSFPQFRTDAVSLDSGVFPIMDLPRWCSKIIEIRQGDTVLPFHHYDESGRIQVMGEGSVNVRYRCLPKPLEDSTDIPELPAHLHHCIVSYVVACSRSEGDASTQGGASVYFQLYNEQKRALMRGGMGTPESYKIENMRNW